jgi:hypothetical protein
MYIRTRKNRHVISRFGSLGAAGTPPLGGLAGLLLLVIHYSFLHEIWIVLTLMWLLSWERQRSPMHAAVMYWYVLRLNEPLDTLPRDVHNTDANLGEALKYLK